MPSATVVTLRFLLAESAAPPLAEGAPGAAEERYVRGLRSRI